MRDFRLLPIALLAWITCFVAIQLPKDFWGALIHQSAVDLASGLPLALTLLATVSAVAGSAVFLELQQKSTGKDSARGLPVELDPRVSLEPVVTKDPHTSEHPHTSQNPHAPQHPQTSAGALQTSGTTTFEQSAGETEGGAERYATTIVFTVLAMVFVVLRVCTLHLELAESGMPQLAQQRMHVSAIVEVTSEPKPMKSFQGTATYWYTGRVHLLTANGKTTNHPAQLQIMGNGNPSDGPQFGSTVRVEGALQEPRSAGRTVAQLKQDGVHQLVSPPHTVNRLTNHMRAELKLLVGHMSPQARALVPGAAIGDTREMSEELSDAMKVSGLTHITAVSGSHFAIIFMIVHAATWRLRVGPRACAIAIMCLAFVALVHPSGSVLRALIMGLVSVYALTRKRRTQGLAALAVAILSLLMFDPYQAADYGFILSVVATAGLVIGSSPIARFLNRPRLDTKWLPKPVAHALAVPIAAQLAVGPVLAFIQPFVSLYSVAANVLAAPALAPATIFGLLAALFGPINSSIAMVCAYLASGATWWIAIVAQFFAGLPGAKIPWAQGLTGACTLALLTAVTILVCIAIRNWQQMRMFLSAFGSRMIECLPWMLPGNDERSRDFSRGWKDPLTTRIAQTRLVRGAQREVLFLRSSLVVVLLVVIVGTVFVLQPLWLRALLSSSHNTENWQVWACDVGQGDGFLAKGSDGKTYMFDVGQEGQRVQECFEQAGVTIVDVLFISHFHADHYGALGAVLDRVQVRQILTGPLTADSAAAGHIFSQARERGVPVAAAGSTVALDLFGEAGMLPYIERATKMPQLQEPSEDGAPWQVAWPTVAEAESLQRMTLNGNDRTNDLSMVVSIELEGGTSALFLGDLERDGQQRFADYLESLNRLGRVDVVKMAHHGSASQSAELARILNPSVTLIGVGANNTYGHPHRSAVTLYEDTGSAVLGTHLCGSFGVYQQSERWFVVGGCP